MPNNDEPVFRDAIFRAKRKRGAWLPVDAVRPGTAVADTHAHLQMLADPALSLARCAVHGVRFVADVCDVCEDGGADDAAVFEGLQEWIDRVPSVLAEPGFCASGAGADAGAGENGADADDIRAASDVEAVGDVRATRGVEAAGEVPGAPRVRIIVGCHPHNAKDFTPAAQERLRARLGDSRVCAIGEIGLDYHYDFSPRPVQQEVFRWQIRLAHELDMPISLHLREAHDDALRILCEEGFPRAGTLLHCFNLGPAELAPFLEHDCYIAFGGPITFRKADEVREAAKLVPLNRLLTETDAPYMTPEPMRGTNCGPEHVIFTAMKLAEVRGCASDAECHAFLDVLFHNAQTLLNR